MAMGGMFDRNPAGFLGIPAIPHYRQKKRKN
jgi:hypothetical protein